MCHTHDHEDSVFHKPCPRSTYIIEYVRVSCYTNAFSFFFKCLRAGWMHTLQSFLQCGVVFLACTAGCDVTCRRSLHAYRMQMCTQSCNNPSTLCAVLCIAMHTVCLDCCKRVHSRATIQAHCVPCYALLCTVCLDCCKCVHSRATIQAHCVPCIAMHVCRRQAPPTHPRTFNNVEVETRRKLCHIGEDAASVSDVVSLLMDPASLFFPISRIMSCHSPENRHIFDHKAV